MPFIVRLFIGTLLGFFVVKVVFAAPARVEITDVHLKNLGVNFVTLGPAATAAAARYSGRFVLPPAADRAVSTAENSRVEQVLVHEGQWVKKGDILARVAGEAIAQQQLALVQAAAKHRLAADAFARDKSLLSQGYIAKRRLQESEAEAQAAQGELLLARAALRLSGAAEQAVSRVEAGGQVTGQLDVVSPQAGRVADLSAKAGVVLGAGSALLHLINADKLWVEVQVPVQLSTQGLQGKTLLVNDAAQGGEPIKAQIFSVSPQVSGVQTRMILAELPNPDSQFTAGQLVEVSLPLAADKAVVELPNTALVRHEGKAQVFVREASHLNAVTVEVLGGSGSQVLVTPVVAGQLPQGARVASSGLVAIKAAWLGIGGGE